MNGNDDITSDKAMRYLGNVLKNYFKRNKIGRNINISDRSKRNEDNAPNYLKRLFCKNLSLLTKI